VKPLTYTLITDGSSDAVLMRIVDWLLRQHLPDMPIAGEWADFRQFRTPPKNLDDRITQTIALYPCEVLFIHRDAETKTIDDRRDEIDRAIRQANVNHPYICVVPVRMQEAWLLLDETAIRWAAGNPNGKRALDLPNYSHIEAIPDPKELLYDTLKTASELGRKRLKKFRPNQRIHRITDYIEDYSALRNLSAFEIFEDGLINTLSQMELIS